MSMAMIRDLYEYHRWANRKLFDFAAALGEGTKSKDRKSTRLNSSHQSTSRMPSSA